MRYTQENRTIAVETAAGSDALLLTGITGTEAISDLFRFQLDMLSTDDSLNFEALIGKNATARLTLADGSERYINGYLSVISQGPREDRFATYTAELVPWFWFLTQNSQSRIFQNKKVPDIVQQIFSESGFHDFSLRLYGSFLEREYCVQYRESDFNFISRLLEEEGVFYYFEHENGKHTLVLADSPSAHKVCPGQAQVRHEKSTGGTREEDVISEWRVHRQFRPGRFSLDEYNFETPSASLRASVASGSKFEVYDYPGVHRKQADGENLARIRFQESEARAQGASGVSDCRAFASGYKFQLGDHYRKDQNGWYVLRSVVHAVRQPGNFNSRTAAGDEFHYSNSFDCCLLDVPFRPVRKTPKPVIHGSQTAFVTGPAGEEIFTDKYGRIKVQFHWDREGKDNENSSCWIRVAQWIAGKQWGSVSLPRAGQEVVVEFLEGDPDRPIVTGSVYNAEHMPPYTLPAERTKTSFKSRSSPGGDGFNELRFEDAKGKEQIFLHGERDLEVRVKNDVVETTGGGRHVKTAKDHFEEISADRNLTVKGDDRQKIGSALSLSAGTDCHIKAGSNYAVEAGMEVHVKAGMTLVLEAGMELTLKVGGNFVSIGPTGVTISGAMVLINSGGAAGSGSGSSPDVPALPREAVAALAGALLAAKPGPPAKPEAYGPSAAVLQEAAKNGTPFCEICAKLAREGGSS